MYDYIIIGAGSAGCVLANRLSADLKTKVLLLEAGPKDTKMEISIPAAWSKLLKSKVDWAYHSEPMPKVNNRRIFIPRGKTLGGSSSINAMLYIRGHQVDYDGWAALGNPGWDYQSVLPYFIKAENNQRITNEYHGNQGPLCVSDLVTPNPMTADFLAAANASGFTLNDDPNGAIMEGFGQYQVTQKNGKRHSAAAAYLKPVLSRPNLTLITEAMTEKIIIENKIAKGVQYRCGGKLINVTANKSVLLTAGAINSPQLLMLSGIGDSAHLQEKGIAVQHHLPGVGQNLQDHPIFGMVSDSTNKKSLDTAETLANLLRFLFYKKGPMTSPVAEANGFWKSRPSELAPDLQFVFGPAYFVDHGFVRPKGNGFTLGPCLVAPKSRGYVQLHNSDSMAAPLIQPNLLADDDDLERLVLGFKMSDAILHQPALQQHFKGYYAPNKRLQKDDEIKDFIRQNLEALYHPVGTCKMGNDAQSVVNHQLKVHGIANLRVVDASIMPAIVRGNTNAPTIMIAEKCADMLLQA